MNVPLKFLCEDLTLQEGPRNSKGWDQERGLLAVRTCVEGGCGMSASLASFLSLSGYVINGSALLCTPSLPILSPLRLKASGPTDHGPKALKSGAK